MTRWLNLLPILITVLVVSGLFVLVIQNKQQQAQLLKQQMFRGDFVVQRGCGRAPRFLQALKIPQPVLIDLSQQRFKGIAFHHGQRREKILHPQQWESFGGFGTYTLDELGNLYLAPMPYISIQSDTFEQQKNIYQLDSITGKLSVFLRLDDVFPGANNPYGIYTLVYDCDDQTLWVAAIDETDYHSQQGVIYHIDPQSKTILQKIEGFDALTLALLQTSKAKYLLAGSAHDSGLYAFAINAGRLSKQAVKLLELPSDTQHIRKIKIKSGNQLELQAIPFSYTLIAQTSKKYRSIFAASWNSQQFQWTIVRRDTD